MIRRIGHVALGLVVGGGATSSVALAEAPSTTSTKPAALAPDFPQYNHPACHAADARFDPSSGREGALRCTGGWHDAGDYGRYVVNSGVTTATLLWAYELNASKLRAINLDIPESGSRVPD